MPVEESLLTVMSRSAKLSPDGQLRAARRFAERRDYTSLSVMARRRVLDPVVDEFIGSVSAPSVRAAWLGRPGRPVDVVVAAAMKYRAPVIVAELAAVRGLPGSVYEVLAGREVPDADLALLENPSVYGAAALAAAGRVARRFFGNLALSEREKNSLKTVADRVPGAVDVIVTSTKSATVKARFAGHPMLTQVGVEALVAGAEELVAYAKEKLYLYKGALSSLLLALAECRSLSEGHIDRLVKLMRSESVHQDGQTPSLLARFEDLRSVRAVSAQLDAADAGELLVWAEKAIADRDSVLADEITRAPAVTLEVLTMLRAAGRLGRCTGDVIARFNGDPRMQAVALGLEFSDADLEVLSDPGAVLLEVLRNAPADRPGAWSRLMSSRYLTQEHLLTLPVSAVWDSRFKAVQRKVVEMVAERLVTSREWEVFESMAEDGHFTIGECLEVACSIGE
jgi:hypothetical protein